MLQVPLYGGLQRKFFHGKGSSLHDNIPQQPLLFIKDCVRAKRIYWTYHVNMRLKERSIPRSWILHSTDHFEIISSYPDDKYLPSYLVWSQMNDIVFHIVFAVDVENDNVRIITAYRPDPEEWANNMKKRIS